MQSRDFKIYSKAGKMKFTRKTIGIVIAVFVLAGIALPPLLARTGTYPLAVVDGNSMYPHLQNGDLVYYSATDTAHIPNGTIIVFVQSETGVSMLDGLVKPVLIHRIIGEVVQANGTVCYQTQGDNNQEKDPFLTPAANVLGVATLTIPKVGLFLLFLQSPQGLIATVGIISLAYLSMYDAKRKEDKKKEKLLGALAKKALKNELTNEQFKKMELALKYSDDIETDNSKDFDMSAFVDWLKKGALDEKWSMKTVVCESCCSPAIELKAGENKIEICSRCNQLKTLSQNIALTEKAFDELIIESIDEALSNLGNDSKAVVFNHLQKEFIIKKKEIPQRLDDFAFAIKTIFGNSAAVLDSLFSRTLKAKLYFVNAESQNSLSFQDYVKYIRPIALTLKKEEAPRALIGACTADANAPLIISELQKKES